MLIYDIAYTSPRPTSFGDFFRQRICSECPLSLSNLLTGLSALSFVLLSMPPPFLLRPRLRICASLSLPRVSYFLTISSYLHHHILCRLLRFHCVCRLSSVPLMRCQFSALLSCDRLA